MKNEKDMSIKVMREAQNLVFFERDPSAGMGLPLSFDDVYVTNSDNVARYVHTKMLRAGAEYEATSLTASEPYWTHERIQAAIRPPRRSWDAMKESLEDRYEDGKPQ